MNYFQTYLILFSFVSFYEVKNVNAAVFENFINKPICEFLSGLETFPYPGQSNLNTCIRPHFLPYYKECITTRSYEYEISQTVTLECKKKCNDDNALEWLDVKNNITFKRKKNFISLTLEKLDEDDNNTEFICQSYGKDGIMIEKMSVHFKLSETSKKDTRKNTKKIENIYLKDESIEYNVKLRRCKNKIELKDPIVTCYTLKYDTFDKATRYKTLYNLTFAPSQSSFSESTGNHDNNGEEPDSTPLPLAIGVGILGAISLIIITIWFYYCFRKFKARKQANENIYSEINPRVLYAEIQVNQGNATTPSLPARNETPYAQIVGFMARK